jgi:Leu/Phe-tRNA-protein transferase
VQATKDSFKSGAVFALSVWAPDGKLVSGLLVNKTGNVYEPDTTYYDAEVYKNAYATVRLAGEILKERLFAAGLTYVDAGMVTQYTLSLGGQYIPRERFLQMMKELPKEPINVDFSPWQAPDTEKPGKKK